MMIPEIKAKWIAALRSGKYQQTKGVLKDHGGFCCLGVLCVIQGVALDAAYNDLETTVLHSRHAAGLSLSAMENLALLNDGGLFYDRPVKPHSFDEIADFIEKML